jgi:hypothetical protein
LIHGPTCNLPSLPPDLKPPIGFPEPGDGKPADHIFITKTDWSDVLVYVTQLNEWIRSANGCLTAEKR